MASIVPALAQAKDNDQTAKYTQINNTQQAKKNAKAFLVKHAPKYANDAAMIQLIAEGEQEWLGNGKTSEYYYNYIKLFISGKNIAGIKIRNTKRYAPNLFAKLEKNHYEIFPRLHDAIVDFNRLAQLKKENAKLDRTLEILESF